jgi:hypothetical protein
MQVGGKKDDPEKQQDGDGEGERKWPRGHSYADYSWTWPDDPKKSKDWPANHDASISENWPADGDKTITWPPNHDPDFSKTWPPEHGSKLSATWPERHNGKISVKWPGDPKKTQGWPPDHDADFSATWPPGHNVEISAEWPTDPARTREWPRDHRDDFSLHWPKDPGKRKGWPPDHTVQISKTWPDDPGQRKEWPPNHEMNWTAAWPPQHDAERSAAWPEPDDTDGWPANHIAGISKRWPRDPEKRKGWPPDHEMRNSDTWPVDPDKRKGWPRNHRNKTSKKWPDDPKKTEHWSPNHKPEFSEHWPGDHYWDFSDGWPQDPDMTKDWPANHRTEDSIKNFGWPWIHAMEISEKWPLDPEKRKGWPGNHRVRISRKWPEDPEGRKQWPPDHKPGFSETWPKDHTSDISVEWPDDRDRTENWPPNHRKADSLSEGPGRKDEDEEEQGERGGSEEVGGSHVSHEHTDSLKLALAEPIDFDHMERTFLQVISALGKEVTIRPTENYLYFRLGPDERIWGNINLSPPARDEGIVSFAYYKFNPAPRGPNDFEKRHMLLGPRDGVRLSRLGPFRYALSYRRRRVVFNLNRVAQVPPSLFKPGPSEKWLQNTRDEAGLDFHLLFNTTTSSFLWVLNETQRQREEWITVDAGILLGKRTAYVFFVDRAYQGRKILVGVEVNNIKQNNYYDGPFDQLADNYITARTSLAPYIEKAYPYTRGEIDRYGRFKRDAGSRVAITPYLEYRTLREVVERVRRCERELSGDEFYLGITYDAKRGVRARRTQKS